MFSDPHSPQEVLAVATTPKMVSRCDGITRKRASEEEEELVALNRSSAKKRRMSAKFESLADSHQEALDQFMDSLIAKGNNQ